MGSYQKSDNAFFFSGMTSAGISEGEISDKKHCSPPTQLQRACRHTHAQLEVIRLPFVQIAHELSRTSGRIAMHVRSYSLVRTLTVMGCFCWMVCVYGKRA